MLLQGKSVSPGVVRGVTHVVDAPTLLASAANIACRGTPQVEVERLSAAIGRAGAQLDQMRRNLTGRIPSQEVAIFEAHGSLLRDRKFIAQIEQEILQQGQSAEAAVARVARALYTSFRTSNITLAQDKATDILDIGRRLVQCLMDISQTDDDLVANAVVVASSLTPSELVKYAHQGVVGFITETCGQKSHTAILARGFGLPLIALHQGACSQIPHLVDVVLDGDSGLAVVAPTADELPLVTEIETRLPAVRPSELPDSLETITRDGVRIALQLNISDPTEADSVSQYQAHGVGLFRTEFLYMDRDWWPTEEDSYAIYADVARRVGTAELNVRLVDFGAEKSPHYADFPLNRNPSLGLRGIRLLLQREDVLRPQVKALARLAKERPLCVLLPMVDTIDTLLATIDQLCRICGCRTREQLPFRLVTMIEVPAAAILIEEMIERVDGISIGLNDLTQYLLAADRDDEYVGTYHDALQPAVLRILSRLLSTAAAAGKTATICGELAGDPLLTGLMLGVGARQLSVSRTNYLQVVRAIQQTDLSVAKTLADQVLALTTGVEVRAFLAQQGLSQQRSPAAPVS